jgi:hypothetical protein
MQVNDAFFDGLNGWAEQLMLSVMVMARSNQVFRQPRQIFTGEEQRQVQWASTGASFDLSAEFSLYPSLLVGEDGIYDRVIAYNPSNALDTGISRSAVVTYSGMTVPDTLMTLEHLETLEERTAYLLTRWAKYEALVSEWNIFAALQENIWLWIYKEEGAIVPEHWGNPAQSAAAQYTYIAGLGGGFGGATVYPDAARFYADIDRFNYEAKITEWLTDSGTAARSGGVAIDNDSYIGWMAGQLQNLAADYIPMAADNSPIFFYKFAPVIRFELGTEDGGGATGTSDFGIADPAGDGSEQRNNLLEDLLDRGGSLLADLDAGSAPAPIDTLPKC